MVEIAKLELSRQHLDAAKVAAHEALTCAKKGEFCPIWIESEILLSKAHEALQELEKAKVFLGSAGEHLARLESDATFVGLVRSHQVVTTRLGEGCSTQEDYSFSTVRPTETAEREPEHWDVFVSHASEDKEHIATPLVDALLKRGLRVWYDTIALKIGDSLLEKIDEGLAQSAFGVVVLSENFFRKKWTRLELDGLIALEGQRRGRVLPVWHSVTHDDVAQFSPILAGRVAGNTNEGISALTDRLVQAINNKHTGTVTVRGFAALEFDEDWELVGGFNSVRGFVAEAKYNIEKGITPSFEIGSNALVQAQREMSRVENAPYKSVSDRIRYVALRRWFDRYSKVESRLIEGVSLILTNASLANQGYLASDTAVAQSIWSLVQLFQGKSLVPRSHESTEFDIVFDGVPELSARVSLSSEQTDKLQKSVGAENIYLLRRGGYEPVVADLPQKVIIEQAIPYIVHEVLGYQAKGGKKEVTEFFDLSMWHCGLA